MTMQAAGVREGRSRGEIQEIIERRLEDISGEDCREWPDVITTEEISK